MRKLIYTGVALLCAQLAMAQLKVKVAGTVTGDTEGHNKVYFYTQSAKDSAEIKNGKFEINVNEPAAGSRAISIEYDQKKRRMYSPLVLFFDQSGTINVEFDIVKGLSSAVVKGMPSAVTYFSYNAERPKVFMGARQSAITKYGEEALHKSNAQFEVANTYREGLINKGYDSLLNKYFDGNRLVSATLVLNTLSNLSTQRAEDYYGRLSDKAKATDAGKTLYAKIQGLKNAYVGAIVKNFELPDQHGKTQSFEQYKGKYVLLDFWASWCSPCRASFPRIREVYSKLKGKNFEIVNISIDQNKQAWLKAVGEEANPWPQLYDDRKVSYEFFNVSAVPTSYLIDPTGKIIMKEIGFDPKGGGEMEKKLEEIFNIKF
ncbi:Peroxiredoxin [Sphingobacterium nematocida]|uniref:Peroxiredoxin n=1 Tax=Sphingobacterium nematocida TaxID=1513896 RepID=A0A1T5D7V0_9SPHI|nr:TlpA disulfide reductase family protein [Sphingobacterium nematocida]SKB67749.1 Peroxiredoxin [Sphingobacterium nematocida]